MKVVTHPLEITHRGCVIAIGNFDGVHRGHQLLLGRMQEAAADEAKASLIISFHPPSKTVFLGEPYLTSDTEKLEHFAHYQPSAVVLVPFNRAYAKTDKQVFLSELERLDPHHIIVGEDFRFGHQRSGGLDDLSHVTRRLEVFSLKLLGDEPIKSSHIRSLLKAGQVEEARRFLGYSYRATGEVIEGDRRGRQIGFPTANLATPEQKALPLGVFTVRCETPFGTFYGMANVGTRPTFPDAAPSLEVHLFDFSGDLYGKQVKVSFEHFLRAQKRFAGLDELKAQLARDAAAARGALSL